MKVIVDALIYILDLINRHTHNYGWSIILFAVFIKLALSHLTQQQFKSMKDMQNVQPELKKIQERFKDDPQRMNKEMMDFYKRHKINPFGGCLPMLIQMPILFGIWQTIITYYKTFQQEQFLWIGGRLSEYYPAFFAKSLADRDLPLILLYGLSMYLSQKLTVTDPATAKTQSMMNLTMPVIFTYMMWSMKTQVEGIGNVPIPCALILYWLVFNILSIIHQALIMKQPSKTITFEPPPEAPAPAVK